MEELEKIRTDLLKSHRSICKKVNFDGGFIYIHNSEFNVYISGNTYSYSCGYEEVDVSNIGSTTIKFRGDLTKCVDIVKIMKKHKKLLEYIEDNKIEVKHE